MGFTAATMHREILLKAGENFQGKVQSSHWVDRGPPRPEKARQPLTNISVMLSVFIDFSGVCET